jgi:branched-chain amino acid transport system permease protein
MRTGMPWLAGLAVIPLILPFAVTDPFAVDIFIRILLFAFIGVAWNLMGGYAKQLSLGHAAFFGLDGYTSTILETRYDVSPWIGMLAGGVVAMAASLSIGPFVSSCTGPISQLRRSRPRKC